MAEEQIIDPIFFEKLLIKFLFKNGEVRDRILPFLTVDVFNDGTNAHIIKKVLGFLERKDRFPTLQEMKLEIEIPDIYNRFVEITTTLAEEFDNDDVLIDKIEDFFKKKLIFNTITDAAEYVNSDDMAKLGNCPERLRDALSFSFNTQIGLDFFNDKDRLYDFLHDKDKTVSTGIKPFDNIIEGGFHEKSLSLFLAECVDENTTVKIRYRKL